MKNYHYLTNGVLESYLLGLVSDDEKQEVEHLIATDADIQDQLNQLEQDMEGYFLRNAVPPPPDLRHKILARIDKTDIKKREETDHTQSHTNSYQSASATSGYVDVAVSNTHIQVHKNWRMAFIAVFILSKVFLILGLYYYFKSASLEQELIRLRAATPVNSALPSTLKP